MIVTTPRLNTNPTWIVCMSRIIFLLRDTVNAPAPTTPAAAEDIIPWEMLGGCQLSANLPTFFFNPVWQTAWSELMVARRVPGHTTGGLNAHEGGNLCNYKVTIPHPRRPEHIVHYEMLASPLPKWMKRTALPCGRLIGSQIWLNRSARH